MHLHAPRPLVRLHQRRTGGVLLHAPIGSDKSDRLKALFEKGNPESLRNFVIYNVKELGAENVLATLAMKQYSEEPTQERCACLLRILNGADVRASLNDLEEGVVEINLPAEVQKTLIAALYDGGNAHFMSHRAPPPLPAELKSKVASELRGNMSDTFKRYEEVCKGLPKSGSTSTWVYNRMPELNDKERGTFRAQLGTLKGGGFSFPSLIERLAGA